MALTEDEILALYDEEAEREAERQKRSENAKRSAEKNPLGLFQKGGPGGPGRPKGRKTDRKKLTKKHLEHKLFQADTNTLQEFRRWASPQDLKTVYESTLEEAKKGNTKAIEIYLKWIVGIPPKVTQVQHVNLTDMILHAITTNDPTVIEAEYEEIDYSDDI